MSRRMDLDGLLVANPDVDREQVVKVNELLAQLRELGIVPEGYGLEQPFSGNPVSPEESEVDDPLAVYIHE